MGDFFPFTRTLGNRIARVRGVADAVEVVEQPATDGDYPHMRVIGYATGVRVALGERARCPPDIAPGERARCPPAISMPDMCCRA